MASKLRSREAIVGFGALVWGIASVTIQLLSLPEGVSIMWASPLGVFTVAMFVVGTGLIFWGIFKHDVGFSEKEAIVKQRQENLPLLRNSIDAIVDRQRELALKLGKRPIQRFFDEYLKKSREYKVQRKLLNTFHTSDKVTKHKVATLATIGTFFLPKTVCLNNECRDDEPMSKLLAEKEIYYHRSNDRKLSGKIDDLLVAAAKYHSALAFAELATNNQLSYTSAKRYVRFDEAPEILKGFMTRAYKAMNDRMEFLMRGGDL